MSASRRIRRALIELLPERAAVQAFEWRAIARASLPHASWPRDLGRGVRAVGLWERLRRAREAADQRGRIPLAGLPARLDFSPAVTEPPPLGWVYGDPGADEPASLYMRSPSRACYELLPAGPVRLECRIQVPSPEPVEFAVEVRASGAASARVTKRLGGRGEGTIGALSVPLPTIPDQPLTLELSLTGADGLGIWIDPCLIVEPGDGTPSAAVERVLSTPLRADLSATIVPAADHGRPGPGPPRFSLLTPVHDPNPVFLDRAIASILRQSDGDWELCLFDDASTDPMVTELLEAHAAADPRIRLGRSDEGLGISGATNAALAMASGEFVLLLDHDDELTDDAVAAIATALDQYPEADAVYTDEATIDEGNRWLGNFLKPAWSPEFFEANMYSCHLGAYRRALVEELGGLRSECDGSQDYDLLLRLGERTDRIIHVPGVRYFWRIHERSAAAGAKPYAYRAAEQALAAHFDRVNRSGEVTGMRLPGTYRRTPGVAEGVAVAVAVGSGDTREAVIACLEGLPAGVTIACAAAGAEAAERCRDAGVEPLELPAETKRAHLLELAARTTAAERVLLLPEPLAPASDGWLAELCTVADIPGVGAVGAHVLSADDRVEEAGIALANGLPLICDLDQPLAFDDPADPSPTQTCARNVSAVAGPLLVDRAGFERLGGFEPFGFDRLATADLCLRMRADGLRIVVAPAARLRRLGTPPGERPCDLAELARFQAGWFSRRVDPYYHPLCCRERGSWRGSTSPAPLPEWRPAAISKGPEAASGHGSGLRERLAADYLRGEGLEIGPLHSPLGVPLGVGVRYVDRMPVTLLRRHYPELAGLPLVEIDVMDDGERLATVPDESQDFVVANHLLEHTGDPIGTLANWLRVLKPGGVIYLAVPDKRFTFDIEREPTAVEHMVDDFERGAENSRRQHFEEWARHVERVDDELVAERADILEQIDYSVHTHVFTGRTLIELLLASDRLVGPIEIEAVRRNGIETLAVIRKPDPSIVLPEPPRAYDDLPISG